MELHEAVTHLERLPDEAYVLQSKPRLGNDFRQWHGAVMETLRQIDHGEGRLDVGPLVIVPQELLPVEGEIVKHLLPEATSFPAVNAFERNVGRGPMLSNNVRVVHAGVPFIGRDFPHVEVRGCRVHEVS
jgi:hypothetical protein